MSCPSMKQVTHSFEMGQAGHLNVVPWWIHGGQISSGLVIMWEAMSVPPPWAHITSIPMDSQLFLAHLLWHITFWTFYL